MKIYNLWTGLNVQYISNAIPCIQEIHLYCYCMMLMEIYRFIPRGKIIFPEGNDRLKYDFSWGIFFIFPSSSCNRLFIIPNDMWHFRIFQVLIVFQFQLSNIIVVVTSFVHLSDIKKVFNTCLYIIIHFIASYAHPWTFS